MLPAMRMPGLVMGMAGAMVLVACAAEQARVEQRRRDLSAAALGTPSRSLLAQLTPEERVALERAGMGGPAASSEEPDAPIDDPSDPEAPEEPERATETAGKVGVAVLQVGLTLGMLAAPFFLF